MPEPMNRKKSIRGGTWRKPAAALGCSCSLASLTSFLFARIVRGNVNPKDYSQFHGRASLEPVVGHLKKIPPRPKILSGMAYRDSVSRPDESAFQYPAQGDLGGAIIREQGRWHHGQEAKNDGEGFDPHQNSMMSTRGVYRMRTRGKSAANQTGSLPPAAVLPVLQASLVWSRDSRLAPPSKLGSAACTPSSSQPQMGHMAKVPGGSSSSVE